MYVVHTVRGSGPSRNFDLSIPFPSFRLALFLWSTPSRVVSVFYQTQTCCCASTTNTKTNAEKIKIGSRLFSWSMELLAFASRLFALQMLDHLLTTSVCHPNPFYLPSERSGRNRPLRETPCSLYEHIIAEHHQIPTTTPAPQTL